MSNKADRSRLYRLTLILVSAASLASCGGESSDTEATNASAPRLTQRLDPGARQVRMQACLKRMKHYQELGVLKHGGAKPGVARAAWDALSDAEKSEVFDVAACITAGGETGDRIITVAEEGNGPEIETRRVANDRDFAAEVR